MKSEVKALDTSDSETALRTVKIDLKKEPVFWPLFHFGESVNNFVSNLKPAVAFV